MLKIDPKNNKITLTKGDTLKIKLSLRDAAGNVYIPGIQDTITFVAKKNFDDAAVLSTTVYGDGETSDIVIVIGPGSEDTNSSTTIDAGTYKYDIQLTTSDGIIDTVINAATLVITEEVAS